MNTEVFHASAPLATVAWGYGIRSLNPGQSEFDDALRGETLRSLIWAHSNQGRAPVRTRLVLHRAEWITRLLPKETQPSMSSESDDEPSPNRTVLDDLADLREIAWIPGTGWLPAPTRLIEVPPNRLLLLGGVPTSLLPGRERGSVRHHGLTRWIEGNLIGAFIEMRRQPYDEWLDRLSHVEQDAELHRFIHAELDGADGAEGESWEAYAPTVAAARSTGSQAISTPLFSHGRRWLPVDRRFKASGRYLIRRYDPIRGSVAAIGEIAAGSLKKISVDPIDPDQRRRLQFAIDRHEEKPLTMQHMLLQGGTITLRQWSALPDAETRLLRASATSRSLLPGRGLPREWTFTTERSFDPVVAALMEVGVRLQPVATLPAIEREVYA